MSGSRGLLAEIAWRFLRGRRSRLLDGAARSALAAVAIGVAAMVVAMALMAGYRDALQRKLTQDSAAVMVYPLRRAAFEIDAAKRADLTSIPGVEGLRRVAYGQGSLRSAARPDGVDVTLRGIDDDDERRGLGRVVELPHQPTDTSLSRLVVGEDLLAALAPEGGEVIRLMVLGAREGRPRFSYRSARIVAYFTSGLSEFDQRLVIMDRATLEELTGSAVGETILEVLIEDPHRAGEVADDVEEVLGADYVVVDWQELNSELFTAIAVQKLALFLVLGLIVVVSTFNVASSILVLVRERARDVGVLAAVGLSPRELRRLFLLYGGGLSLGGAILGVLTGAGAAWLLTRFELIRFDPELAAIYFLRSVPLEVRLLDVVLIVAFTLAVTHLACWLPALRLGRLEPASALRSE